MPSRSATIWRNGCGSTTGVGRSGMRESECSISAQQKGDRSKILQIEKDFRYPRADRKG
jgi:hypothetical protein